MSTVKYYEEKENNFITSRVIDKLSSEEEQKRVLFEKLEDEGYEFGDRSDYDVSFSSINNDEVMCFVIKHETKKVPYLVNREEIFSGSINDSASLTETERRQKIFNLMIENGVEVDAAAEYEISFEDSDIEYFKKLEKNYEFPTKFNVFKVSRKEIKNDVTSSYIIFEEIEEFEKITSGSLLPENSNLSVKEKKAKVYDFLELSGVEMGSKDEIDVSFSDGRMSFDVRKKVKKIVPYEVNVENVFSGDSSLLGSYNSLEELREKVYALMEDAKVDVDNKEELEIRFTDSSMNLFNVYRTKKKAITLDNIKEQEVNEVIDEKEEDSSKKDESVVETSMEEEVKLTDIFTGNLDASKVNNQKDIDNKVLELLEMSGLNLENVGELKVSYGNLTENNQIPFTVSKVKVDHVNYVIEKEKVGTGIKRKGEDIFAAIQRNHGLDIRNDDNYDVVYDDDSSLEDSNYTLLKIKKTKLDSETINNSNEIVFEPSDFMMSREAVEDEAVSETPVDSQENENNAISDVIQSEENFDSVLELDEINRKIALSENALKQAQKNYGKSIKRMKELDDKEDLAREEAGLVSDEEYIEFKGDSLLQKSLELGRLKNLQKIIENEERKLGSLARLKSKLENGFSMIDEEEVANNDEVLEKVILLHNGIEKAVIAGNRTYTVSNLNNIYKNTYNLPERLFKPEDEIDYVPSNAPSDMIDSSDEQVDVIEDTNTTMNKYSNDAVDEKIVIYTDQASNKKYIKSSVFQRFNAEKIGDAVKINGVSCYEVNDEDLDFIIGNANNEYSPYLIENESFNLDKKNNDTMEKVVIYQDLNDEDEIYAKDYVFQRFNAEKVGDAVKIDDAYCFKLNDEDLDFIIENQYNEYSPYRVQYVDIDLRKARNVEDKKTATKIKIYVDLDNNSEKYVDKSIIKKFNIKSSDSVEIEGNKYYKITEEDVNLISLLSDNSESSYDIEFVEVNLGKREEIVEETITIFTDKNDKGQLYASVDLLKRFNVISDAPVRVVNGVECYPINSEVKQMIDYISNVSKNPKYTIKYEKVKLKKKVRPHVEAIIDKLTSDLDIKPLDAEVFTAYNLNVSDQFKKELKSGATLYNILCAVPAVGKAAGGFLAKLSAKLLSSTVARGALEKMSTLVCRLDEDLTEEELEVLFEDYRGSILKVDMNNHINKLILKRLKSYALKKVEALNEKIEYEYSILFDVNETVVEINDSLNNDVLYPDSINRLDEKKAKLVDIAAEAVRNILSYRKEADKFLSGGINGLEVDVKDCAGKYPLLRVFSEGDLEFNNELQHNLADVGIELNEALADGNSEQILNSFLDLESLYYNGTEDGDKDYSALLNKTSRNSNSNSGELINEMMQDYIDSFEDFYSDEENKTK